MNNEKMKQSDKNTTKGIKVNNALTMDNSERFRNVFLGYSIQATRIIFIVRQQNTTMTKEQIDGALAIMKKIQGALQRLKSMRSAYDKHLNNNVYCKMAMKPYADNLKKIIAETDAFGKKVLLGE
jgi:hypothetical protein